MVIEFGVRQRGLERAVQTDGKRKRSRRKKRKLPNSTLFELRKNSQSKKEL